MISENALIDSPRGVFINLLGISQSNQVDKVNHHMSGMVDTIVIIAPGRQENSKFEASLGYIEDLS
jgi:hypothetical protein